MSWNATGGIAGLVCCCLLAGRADALAQRSGSGDEGEGTTANPILFCTQVPNVSDFATVSAPFANHLGNPNAAPRGGGLWIRYPDGALRDLTQDAGFGERGFQSRRSIAVREPTVHWSGTKALFSMVVGSPGPVSVDSTRWQIYEITGFEHDATPSITKVPHQPEGYNNVSPLYASDDRILFTSDRPRNGEAHLYPQLDEYEEIASVTGIWSLDPGSGELAMLDHTPSGAFSPSIDSFGRVVFTRWDHLVRDQQADDDNICQCEGFGTFNYTSEAADAVSTGNNDEVFPEPRTQWIGHVDSLMPGYAGDLAGWAEHLVGSDTNHFFPWTLEQNGQNEETLAHVGRHELFGYFPAARDDDSNLVTHYAPGPQSVNSKTITNLFHLSEDPSSPGTYLAINAPEAQTHTAGQVVRITAPPGAKAGDVRVEWLTHPETATFDTSPSPNHSGLYRDALPLSDGKWIAAHAPTTLPAGNSGTSLNPDPVYDFRLRQLVFDGAWWRAGPPLTNGIQANVQWYPSGLSYHPDAPTSYSGPLWELWPCEVVARPVPDAREQELAPPEKAVLQSHGVTASELEEFLRTRGLALIVSRNVTRRDVNDRQQPFNLRVAGSSTQAVAAPGTVYEVSHMQIFQGDQIRGLTFGDDTPIPGRRVLAQPLHDPAATNPPLAGAPPGSVAIASDGSTAALVPARRALSWQLNDPNGTGVVRERYWVSFQPGEIRTCAACHGGGGSDQLGAPQPSNPPQALGGLLDYLRGTGQL
jgi:hypothetical protein